jgi:hypothetical protein
MRTVFIDEGYKCHAVDDGTMRPVETDFFDGKCDAYIEGFRLVPDGDTWTREDGTVFKGLMISPWRPFAELDALQREHERQMLAEYAEALKVLGVTV